MKSVPFTEEVDFVLEGESLPIPKSLYVTRSAKWDLIAFLISQLYKSYLLNFLVSHLNSGMMEYTGTKL